MTDQSPNDIFKASSFLQGHNAEYIEQLYARYAEDPNAVDEAWAAFFKELGDAGEEAQAEAAGPSWARADWPPQPSDAMAISAVDSRRLATTIGAGGNDRFVRWVIEILSSRTLVTCSPSSYHE